MSAFSSSRTASQLRLGIFDALVTKDSIRDRVAQRVTAYEGTRDSWFADWFLPTLEASEIALLAREDLVDCIARHDSESGDDLRAFYERCLAFNAAGRPAATG